MPPILLAYDADGHVIQSVEQLVQKTPNGPVLVDFAAHEAAGTPLTDFWHVEGAKGSKVWPERLRRAYDYQVELAGEPGAKHIAAVVHRESRERLPRPETTAK